MRVSGRRTDGGPLRRGQEPGRLRSEGQDEAESVFDILEQLASDAAGGCGQKVTIDGDDLRGVGDRVLPKTGGFGRHDRAETGSCSNSSRCDSAGLSTVLRAVKNR